MNEDWIELWREKPPILSEREALILEMRNNKKTLREIGEHIGRTLERIRQIEAKAKCKLEIIKALTNKNT